MTAWRLAMRLLLAGFNQRLVSLGRHAGQGLEECDDLPEIGIRIADPPGGHARHLDPVLDDPELLLGISRPAALRETGRLGIEAGAQLVFLHARREMARGAH